MKVGYGVKVIPILEDLSGNVIRDYGEQSNLILDSGLNILNGTYISYCMSKCCIGTGTKATNRGSGLHRVSAANSETLVVDGGSELFTVDDALYNRVIQFDTNTSARILTFVSESEVLLDKPVTVTAAACIIWETEQTKMDEMLRMTGTLDKTIPENNGTVFTADDTLDNGSLLVEIFRTFQYDFIEETPIITEAGWTWTAVDDPDLFGRIKFDEPIVITENTRLKLKVIFSRSILNGPVTSDPIFQSPAVWDTTNIQNTYRGISYVVNDTGQLLTSYSIGLLEPYSGLYMVIKDAIGTTMYNGAWARLPYVQNTYERVYETWWDNSYITAPVGMIQFGNSAYAPAIILQYDNPVEMPPNSKLKLELTVKWDRVLPPFPTV